MQRLNQARHLYVPEQDSALSRYRLKPSCSSVPSGIQAQIGGRGLTAATILLKVVGDGLALGQAGEARSLHGRDMHEYVRAAAARLNEAEALGWIEPLPHARTSADRFPHTAPGRTAVLAAPIETTRRRRP